MVFAAPILILAYIGFLCLCFTIAVVLPVMFVILAVLSLAALVILAIVWRKLKKKGWFAKENHERLLCQEGGYWKVLGMKTVRVALTVMIVLSCLCLAVCAVFAAIIYL